MAIAQENRRRPAEGLASVPWLTPWTTSLRDGALHFTNSEMLKAAVLYLLVPEEIDMLVSSILLLREHFLHAFAYPVVIFYPPGLHPEQLKDFQAKVPKGVQAFWLELPGFGQLPEGLDLADVPDALQKDKDFPLINHITRFWWAQVWQHPLVQHLDYFLRLDSDSFVLAPIEYDVFRYMHLNQLAYGYITESYDGPEWTVGLFDLVEATKSVSAEAQQHAAGNNLWLPPVDERDKHGPRMFYTNFEVVDVQRVLNDAQYMAFVATVDQTHNIYTRRWMDGPLRWHAAMLFWDFKADTRQFCDIDYFHQGRIQHSC
ncbi:hypothetical protein WJX72_005791 [[Myrmecia] bisecta]|uniref:Uncharacterized protein n=1 Tax=[Myrmecia] bisecta TaxID=41462 RepID=A0AAW1P6V8_9CHLO